MSFYRSLIAAVAAMGLATAVCAKETTTNTAAPAAKPEATAAQPAVDAAKLDINKATAKDLANVKGLTQTKAKSIVSFRKKHGDFKSLDELKEVKGFKRLDEKTLKDIQDQLTLG